MSVGPAYFLVSSILNDLPEVRLRFISVSISYRDVLHT